MAKVTTGGVEVPKLRSYIDRIERLEEDKAGIASDIKDVFAEAKSNGFDNKAMREILKLRKMKANERTEAEYMLDLYKRALGMDGTVEDDDADDAAREAAQDETPPEEMDEEQLYEKAKTIVREDKNASTSRLQRHLRIGYNHAARIIERMERDGIVGPANHVGKREVLDQAA